MNARNRPPCPTDARRRRRTALPRLENLEHRPVLSQLGGGPPFAQPDFVRGVAPPGPGVGPRQINPSLGATPQQLESAYGIDQVSFGGTKGDGYGQTVAIVDVGDNPGFVDTADRKDFPAASWGCGLEARFGEAYRDDRRRVPRRLGRVRRD